MTGEDVELYFGKEVRESLQQTRRNVLFRMFKVSSWGNLLWVGLGLAGQAAFSGRMLIQWIVSEKSRKSVVPAAFWYLSLFGALALFAYFVWRQDAVGVLGQAPGLVIYIRNLRLLAKQKRRAARMSPGAAT
ncbi:MAG: lipid A biosynthesis protein [Tepidisphaera sp.]